MPAPCAGYLRLSCKFHVWVFKIFRDDIHESRLDVPVKHVLSSIEPWRTSDFAGAEVHLLAFFDQFFGDLDPRLGTANDKNSAGFQLRGVTIFGGVYLIDPRWEFFTNGWRAGCLHDAGGYDHVFGVE